MTGTKWDRMPMLGLDFESTAADPHEARMVTAALVCMQPDQRPRIDRYVVDPLVEIPEEAAQIHGYTRDRAIAEATHTVDQALFEIVGRVALWLEHGKPLVIMNARYDVTLLEAECHRRGVEGLVARRGHVGKIGPVIDPYVIDKAADKYRKGSRKLVDLCATYGVQMVGAHDAAADALAACRLWPRIIARHPETFRGFTLPALHQAQTGWAREQAVSLAAYFNRIGEHEKATSVSTDWPLERPPVTTVETQGSLL
jgi:DNA polymerase-3 subunit epsilon